ncbi:MAG: hypothetical protein QM765_38265 [Myxococcales bacterium]
MTRSERPLGTSSPRAHRGRLAAAAALSILAACKSSSPLPAPVPASVTPATVERGKSVKVTVAGDRFYVRPEVDLENGPTRLHATFTASLGTTALADVTWVDTRHLTATVPATLAEGTYDLELEGPYGKATLKAAFVVTPPAAPELKATLTAPDQAGVNQSFDVVLEVENPGQDVVAGVLPDALAATGAGTVTFAPPSFTAVDLAGGASTRFTWHATGSAPGAVDLEVPVSAAGYPAVASARTSMLIRGSASLAGTASVAPDKVSVGQTFRGVLGVSNPTDSAVSGVNAAVDVQPDGAARIEPPPPPPLPPQDVPAQGSTEFSYSFVALRPGTATLVFTAAGTDAQGEPAYLNPVTATVLVQRPPEALRPGERAADPPDRRPAPHAHADGDQCWRGGRVGGHPLSRLLHGTGHGQARGRGADPAGRARGRQRRLHLDLHRDRPRPAHLPPGRLGLGRQRPALGGGHAPGLGGARHHLAGAP